MAAANTYKPDRVSQPARDPWLTLLLLLWPLMFVATWAAWSGHTLADQLKSPPPARTSVNPNTAPWWELTILRGVGRMTAGQIVRFRQFASQLAPNTSRTRAFQYGADLTKIRGIGTITVQRIVPELRFSD